MQKIVLLIALAGILFSCKSEEEKNQEKLDIAQSALNQLQKNYYQNQLDSVISKQHFNGSISVYKGQQQWYAKNHGYEDFRSKEKFDSVTVFAIGSLSKQFTAVLCIEQEEAGRLKSSDKVVKYIPEFNSNDRQDITIHQLLNHSSGIQDFSDQLAFPPGKGFQYSNKGFRYLGQVLEKASGKPFDSLATQLFKKAKMNNTFTANTFTGDDFAAAFVGNYNQATEVPNMPERLEGNDIGIPAGGILSTQQDLHLWNQALYNGQLIKPSSVKKLTAATSTRKHPIFGKVGYGYGIMSNLEAPTSYFHTGYVKGSPSLLIFYPETQTSVIILSNLANESKGISGIFKPHAEIKKTFDDFQRALIPTLSALQKEFSAKQ